MRQDAGRRLHGRALGAALCVLIGSLVFGATAQAVPPSFKWTGETSSRLWSEAGNWAGAAAPKKGAKIGTFEFPALTGECANASPVNACYSSFNDVKGLSAETLKLDDGNTYLIRGNALTLGSGGLTSTPAAGTSGEGGDILETPLQLGASQTWEVTEHSEGSPAENGLLLGGALTGATSALTVNLSNEAGLFLAAPVELGSLSIKGSNASQAGVFNGLVDILGTQVNQAGERPVSLSNIFALGTGAVGALTTTAAELNVGNAVSPAGRLEPSSASLDSASLVQFDIVGPENVAGESYSQLSSHGAIALGGSKLRIVVAPPRENAGCPELVAGQSYTFVSTSGELSGSFANAPTSGAEIPVTYATVCGSHPDRVVRIAYGAQAGFNTVTATVVEGPEEVAAKKRHEEEVKHAEEAHRHAEEEARRLHEAEAKAHSEEALKHAAEQAAAEAAAKHHAEEAAAATNKKREEEQHAQSGVQSFQSTHPVPDAELAGTTLEASSGGMVTLSIRCPAGESACSGTVTLRTANAVAAKKAVLTLGSASFTVAGGKVGKVKLRLSSRARRLLARVHKVRARTTISASDPLGGKHTAQTIVTLRAARHGKH